MRSRFDPRDGKIAKLELFGTNQKKEIEASKKVIQFLMQYEKAKPKEIAEATGVYYRTVLKKVRILKNVRLLRKRGYSYEITPNFKEFLVFLSLHGVNIDE